MYSDPKLSKAFKKSIKHYFDNNELSEYNSTVEKRRYDKKYFDTLDSELFPKEEVKKSKNKSRSDPTTSKMSKVEKEIGSI